MYVPWDIREGGGGNKRQKGIRKNNKPKKKWG